MEQISSLGGRYDCLPTGMSLTIELVQRQDNAWANILTRWDSKNDKMAARATVATLYAPIDIGKQGLDLPTQNELIAYQSDSKEQQKDSIQRKMVLQDR